MEETTIVLDEKPNVTYGKYIGCTKWFSDTLGFGFITIMTPGEYQNKDIFVHHSQVCPLNSQFKSLERGEYVSFDIAECTHKSDKKESSNVDKNNQAVNVRGVYGGPLYCDNVQNKRYQKVDRKFKKKFIPQVKPV